MNFLNLVSNNIEAVSVPDYYDSMITTRFVRIPNAYGIPISMKGLIDLLHSHGFTSRRVNGNELYKIQKYLILSCDPLVVKSKLKPPTNVRIVAFRDERSLDNYEIFSIDQEGGHSLLLLIEPQSEYGFSRYENLGLEIRPGMFFPVLRITDDRFKNA
jgi:hypothetical protein